MKRISNNPTDPTHESCGPLTKLPAIEISLNDFITCDVAGRILFFLRYGDMQSMVSVSRRWNTTVINEALQKYKLLDIFVKCLIKKLPVEFKESSITDYSPLTTDMISTLKTLPKICTPFEDLKKEVFYLFLDFKAEDLTNLEKLSKTETELSTCENLFDLVKIYKKIDENLELYRKNEENNEENDEEYDSLLDLSVEVMALGDLSKGLETIQAFAEIYPEGEDVCDTLCSYLMNKNLTEEAIAVARSISDSDYTFMAMSTICDRLIGKDLFNEALDVILMLCPYDDIKTTELIHRFADIYKIIKQKTGDYVKANAVFLKVPLKLRKHPSYQTKKRDILNEKKFLEIPNQFYYYECDW